MMKVDDLVASPGDRLLALMLPFMLSYVRKTAGVTGEDDPWT
jgi:hypothetical protein